MSLILIDCRNIEEEGTMNVLLMMFILNIASLTFSNGEEEEDRDELQRGFYEVDYMLQVPIFLALYLMMESNCQIVR